MRINAPVSIVSAGWLSAKTHRDSKNFKEESLSLSQAVVVPALQ